MRERIKAEAFRALHVRGRPCVLFDIWDVGGAKVVEEAGAAGLIDEAPIARVCEASPLPVNVMVGDASPTTAQLAAAGVARISPGPRPYLMAKALREAAAGALAAAP